MNKIVCGVLVCALSMLSPMSCNSGSKPSGSGQTPIVSEPPFTPHESAEGVAERLVKEDEKLVDFADGASPDFNWADGYSNGNEFNCTWRRSSAVIDGGAMKMSVSREGDSYAGAEYRTNNRYSYGFYAVSMKPASCAGIISSFFTYTYIPVWDEIDIEFLGKDMTCIQFNYYTNGVGGHEYCFDLGFDASKDFHEYAFDWQPGSIAWYVDGIPVYRATNNVPSHDMQIMANVWNPIGLDGWCGKLNDNALPATAQYEWFAYSPHNGE